jgi:hypothetical protein
VTEPEAHLRANPDDLAAWRNGFVVHLDVPLDARRLPDVQSQNRGSHRLSSSVMRELYKKR